MLCSSACICFKVLLFKNYFIFYFWLCQVLAAEHWLFVAMQGLLGSVNAVHGLNCPEAHGILAPQQEIKLVSPALEDRFLTTGSPEKSLAFIPYWILKMIASFFFFFFFLFFLN